MRSIEITVYKFDELSDDAKQACIEKHRNYNQYGYAWDAENQDTLKAFISLFHLNQRNDGSVYFHSDNDYRDLEGIRLMSYLWNNYRHKLFKGKYYSKNSKHRYSKCQIDNSCVLTGYGIDDDILQLVYEAMNKPYNATFEDLLNECVQAWVTAVERDHAYQDSDEYIIEQIQSNDNDYYSDGSIYNY